MGIKDFGHKGEIFSIGTFNFDIQMLVKELNTGKYKYETKEIKPFNPEESLIYIDKDKLPKNIDYKKPISLFLSFKYKDNQTNMIVDGNHRMYKAWQDGIESVKIIVVKDINLIKKISYTYGGVAQQNNFKKQITEDVERIPNDILGRLRKKFKLKKYCVGQEGCYGRVYELTNGNLLKVTTSQSEANIASKLVGKNLKYIANVYWVNKIKGEELWIYEVEKLKIPWTQQDIFLYEELMGDWFELEKESPQVQKRAKFFLDGLDLIKNEIYSLGFSDRVLDLHIYNLGLKNGNLAIFDLDDAMRTKFDTQEIEL
jgi:hypothetical protein